MSIKNECAIVRDLLPLYAENMVCGETAEFVRGHLDGCASCRAELEQIGSAQSDAENRTDKNPAENDTAPLARIGKNIFKKKMYARAYDGAHSFRVSRLGIRISFISGISSVFAGYGNRRRNG